MMKKRKFRIFALCSVLALVVAALGATTSGALPPTAIEITNCAELQAMSDDITAHYVLAAEIDCDVAPFNSGAGFIPIGQVEGEFSGSLDGQGHTISGLMINVTTNNNAGLFAQLATGSFVSDLAVEDADISITTSYATGIIVGDGSGSITDVFTSGSVSGSGDYVGGIAGDFDGDLTNVGTSANIGGSDYVGGIVGYLHGNIVERAFSTGDVTAASDYVGGAFGYSYDAEVTRAYATGDVTTAAGYAGGFAGSMDNSYFTDTYARGNVSANGDYVGGHTGYPDYYEINNSYSTGLVTNTGDTTYEGGFSGYDNSSENDSFWDINTSGMSQTYGGGAYGLTTAEMKFLASFTDITYPGLDIAWDFVGNPNDDAGTEDIWDIDPDINDGYPFLTFEPYTASPPIELDDLDGIPAEIEDAAPNGGDGNNDGTLDSEQFHVTSFPSPITDQYVVVASSGECRVSAPSIDIESTTSADVAFDYPVGLLNFVFAECDPGTTTATLFFYNLDNDNFVPRKFNATTGAYTTLDTATIEQIEIDSIQVTKVTYGLVDGGPLDADGVVNNEIVDPVGLGQVVVGSPRTGAGGTA